MGAASTWLVGSGLRRRFYRDCRCWWAKWIRRMLRAVQGQVAQRLAQGCSGACSAPLRSPLPCTCKTTQRRTAEKPASASKRAQVVLAKNSLRNGLNTGEEAKVTYGPDSDQDFKVRESRRRSARRPEETAVDQEGPSSPEEQRQTPRVRA